MTEKNYIIGYGSLMSLQSVLKTLKNLDVFKINILPIEIYGVERGWFTKSSRNNFTALGVVKNLASKFNGTLIGPLSKKQMYELDKREKRYKRIEIKKESIKTLKQNNLIPQDNIWIYTTKNKKLPTSRCPIIQTYIDVVISGSLEISKNFTKEFIETTTGWDGIWINDRKNPVYQRAVSLTEKQKQKIDKLFKK
ncbi:MAG: hypothetical protein U9P70_02395 [Patescibacteria group bacterium]|nr:hypothetical protein [Patescibacteria group bacterium]